MTAASTPKVLIIGYVWPEPQSSAAGLRDRDLIRLFKEAGWEVIFASSATRNAAAEAVARSGIRIVSVAANDPAFDEFIRELQPECVIFDRFVTEEQFGWRVREQSPASLRVVDTQDLHLLRRARAEALRSGTPLEKIFNAEIDLFTEDAAREIASIYRSDLSLILSSFELNLLREKFKVPEELIRLAPFCYDPPPETRGFRERKDFVMIGNFRHPPNADAVHWMKRELWPAIRKEIPDAEVHVYGAYPSREMMSLTDSSQGFVVQGPARDQYETLAKYRVNLAPLRFGAGIKGKIADGWWSGTPAVTTAIGAEGMEDDRPWGGAVANNSDVNRSFVEAAVRLYRDETSWDEARLNGYRLLSGLFDYSRNAALLLLELDALRAGLSRRREANFTGKMLWHHMHQSTKYFSRWIELKESARAENPG